MASRAAGWVVAAALLGGGVAAAAPHPFSFDDMVKLAKVADPQISGDERVAYFTIARARADLNRAAVPSTGG